MYTFKKIEIDEQIIVALVITYPEQILINFCTILRLNTLWKKQLLSSYQLYSVDKLNSLKQEYQESLKKMILRYHYALVDISNGEIRNPKQISQNQILAEYKGPLPF